MNGRAYDYNLGRFLSVDPFIQSPGNSQSMNPYSYIMNNPLSGTDPSGYTAECEDALGKGCGGDEPEKPRRDPRSGKGFGWQTVWKSGSGKEHYGTVEDSNGKRHNAVIRTNVEVRTEDIGSTPIKDIESITIVGDDSVNHMTVRPKSGGTDSEHGISFGRLNDIEKKIKIRSTIKRAHKKAKEILLNERNEQIAAGNDPSFSEDEINNLEFNVVSGFYGSQTYDDVLQGKGIVGGCRYS